MQIAYWTSNTTLFLILVQVLNILRGPGSSVGIATDYRLDGPGSNHG